MGKRRNVNAFPVEKLDTVLTDDEGNVVLVFVHVDGTEIAFQVPPFAADELTGALIERPGGGYRELGSTDEHEQDVVDHSFEQVEPDAYVLRLVGEDGPSVTFRMGTKRVRRIRNMMTAHIVRKERGDNSQ